MVTERIASLPFTDRAASSRSRASCRRVSGVTEDFGYGPIVNLDHRLVADESLGSRQSERGRADWSDERSCLRGNPMALGQPTKDEERGRVLAFRPRTARSWNAQLRPRDPSRSPVRDLSKYCGGPEEDDYPHRMWMNLLAFLVLSFIVGCGIWLADNISPIDNRGCGRIGPTDCLPISAPSNPR